MILYLQRFKSYRVDKMSKTNALTNLRYATLLPRACGN